LKRIKNKTKNAKIEFSKEKKQTPVA